LKNYNNYILEIYKHYLSDTCNAISEEEYLEIFEKCCIGVNIEDDAPIYRYIENINDDFTLVDPRKVTRVSANTKNYYTLLIDNDPIWEKYPKRKHGIVSSLHNSYFGNDFRVIPLTKYDDILKKYNIKPFSEPKWGVCPTTDIWMSIDKSIKIMISELSIKDDILMTSDDLNYSLSNIATNFDENLSQNDFNELKDQLIYISNEYYKLSDDEITLLDLSKFDKIILDFMKKRNMNLFEVFQFIYDPEINGFEINTYNELILKVEQHEIWTDTPVLYLMTLYGRNYWIYS
jgi:hypothetical protein